MVRRLRFRSLALSITGIAVITSLDGCVTVDQTIYLQGLEAESGLNMPGVFVTDSSDSHRPHLSLRVSHSSTGSIGGTMAIRGPRPPDTLLSRYRTENLRWSIPATSLGLDVNVPFSRTFGFEGGVQMSSSHTETHWGGYAGLAFSGGGRGASVRLSGGLRFSSVSVIAPSVVVERTTGLFSPPTEKTWFYRDSLEISPLDWYLTLTLNTDRDEWPVNLFVQGAVLRQGLARFSPRVVVYPLIIVNYSVTDARLDYTATLWSVTPGACVRVSDGIRILAGARWVFHDIDAGRPQSLWMPFLQADMLF